MPIEKFKDVTIKGVDYQVGLVTALVGDWISRTLVTGINSYGESGYQKIRSYLLSTCSVYHVAQNGVRLPMRVFDNGKWLCPDLELDYDLETVNGLCEECMKFNFDDFFKKRMAKVEAEQKQEEAAHALQSSATLQ